MSFSVYYCIMLRAGCLALILCTPLFAAENASEIQLRAAYLVNFLKYVEWPAGSGGATICIYGRNEPWPDLVAYEGKVLLGKEIHIRRVTQPEQLADCQELFVPEREDSPRVLKWVGSHPLLSVGENPAFVQQGGIIALLRIDNRLVFDVNLAAASRAGLHLGSSMLRLARDVSGGPR